MTDPSVARVAWFTIWQAALSTLATLVVGVPGAYVLARWSFRGRKIVRSLITVPFVMPTVVVASAFLALLGPRSPLNRLSASLLGDLGPQIDLRRTVTAIVLAHVFFNYAVIVRTVGGLWSHLDPRLEDAARTLGASRWSAFWSVTWPRLSPAIWSSSAIVFLFTFTSFGVVLILGGPTRATLEVEIHRATTQLLDLRLAAVLSILQLIAVVAALNMYGRLTRRPRAQELIAQDTAVRPIDRTSTRWFVGANLTIMLMLLAMPLLVLIERSLAVGQGWGFDHYRALFAAQSTVLAVAPWQAIRNSIVFGVAATMIAVTVGLFASMAAADPSRTAARLVDRALMLPLGTSAVTVGFGFLITFNRPPFDLRGSAVLVPLAQALVATPFVVRTLLPVLRSIDQRLRVAAAVLGAPPAKVWREIDLPILARSTLVAAGFAFAIAVGEFGATVFVARAHMPTMPVAIFRLLGRPGATHFGQAMAMAVLLMLVTAIAIAVIDRARVGQIGRF